MVVFLLMPLSVRAAPSNPTADWTIAVYLDSDNGLDYWAQKDLNEMIALGSTSSVNIVVFWDRYDGP